MQRFHDVTLANGATINNAHFERLISDPVPIQPGRIWFNTTDRAFRYSSLDVGGAITVHSFADAASLIASVTALQTSLTTEINNRIAGDAAEVTARSAAVTSLTEALAQEVADRTAAVAAEATARIDGLATEAQQRTDAIAVAAATAANATATERDARLAGDAALGGRVDNVQDELDVTQAAAGLNVDGTFTPPENTTYLGAVVSLKDADVKLDKAISDEATTRSGQVAGLASALANEAQSRADGDANLQSQLEAWVAVQIATDNVTDTARVQAEADARISKDSALQAELDRTQATVGTDADGNLIPITGTNYLNAVTTVFGGAYVLDTEIKRVSDEVVAEGLARATADSNFHDQLQQEVSDRAGADSALQTELNTTQGGAGLESNGSYAPATDSNYLNDATTLKDADHKLDAALQAVSDRATAIETVVVPGLQGQITAEVNRATAAEAAEVTARADAITGVTTALSGEITRATGIEAGLRTDLTGEANRATGVEAGLQSQINAVVAAAGEGSNALKSSLNSGRYTFKSTGPALVHVVAHNLNTEFYSANIMVKGTDGVWRNDIMPVEDIDLNSYRVNLSEACDIKASGQSNAQVA